MESADSILPLFVNVGFNIWQIVLPKQVWPSSHHMLCGCTLVASEIFWLDPRAVRSGSLFWYYSWMASIQQHCSHCWKTKWLLLHFCNLQTVHRNFPSIHLSIYYLFVMCHIFSWISIITLSSALIKTFTWRLGGGRGGVTLRQARNKVQGVGCRGEQIRSQIMTLLFTWSQWMEDYPWASGTGPVHADSVCGFDKVGSSQSSAPRELDATTGWMLSGFQRLRRLNMSNTRDWTAARVSHRVMIQHVTPRKPWRM